MAVFCTGVVVARKPIYVTLTGANGSLASMSINDERITSVGTKIKFGVEDILRFTITNDQDCSASTCIYVNGEVYSTRSKGNGSTSTTAYIGYTVTRSIDVRLGYVDGEGGVVYITEV